MADKDYVLGTHDEEIERLGLQHRVWRPRVLDAWRRAGITVGQSILDVGAGPGYASLDLAEIVGPQGHVMAVERSRRFLDTLEARAKRTGLSNVTTLEADVMDMVLPAARFDASWCRWLLCFLTHPVSVVAKIAQALKPGGVAVFHEYLEYRTWRMVPRVPQVEHFSDKVMEQWRASGSEPNIAQALPGFIADAGLELVEARPLIDVVPPSSFVWRWPAAFIDVNVPHQVSVGHISQEEGDQIQRAFKAVEANPNALMVTPLVLEIIARKPL